MPESWNLRISLSYFGENKGTGGMNLAVPIPVVLTHGPISYLYSFQVGSKPRNSLRPNDLARNHR